MIKYELKKEYDKDLCDGKGNAIFHRCLEESEFGKNHNLLTIVEIEPGATVGFHKHHGESEFYYFLEGTGTYDDNGKGEYEIKPGMVTMTYDGEGHALANTGDTPMKFMAVIIKE